jgi:hypothetical protein
MEATQPPNPLTFESVWAGLQETRQIMNETFDRIEREREKSTAEFNQRLGEYINLFGEVTEYSMAPKLREKFAEFGFDFQKTTRQISIRDSKNDIFLEIDAMLENGDTAMLVEIKAELTVERIKKHVTRLEKMRKYANLRGDKRVFLGAVAAEVVTYKEREYASDQGLYLIEPAGQDLHITPPNDKPREW